MNKSLSADSARLKALMAPTFPTRMDRFDPGPVAKNRVNAGDSSFPTAMCWDSF